MGIKLIKIAFIASTTVISFAAGVGTGSVVVAWAFSKGLAHQNQETEDVEEQVEDEKE